MSVIPGGHPAIQSFLKSMGLDPTIVGDFEFTVRASVAGALSIEVTGHFHAFLTAEQFAELKGLAPEVRRAAFWKIATFTNGNVEVMDIE